MLPFHRLHTHHTGKAFVSSYEQQTAIITKFERLSVYDVHMIWPLSPFTGGKDVTDHKAFFEHPHWLGLS